MTTTASRWGLRGLASKLPSGVKARLRTAAHATAKAKLDIATSPRLPTVAFEKLPVRQAIRVAYNTLLLREPDAKGEQQFVDRLTVEGISRTEFLQVLRGSEEFRFGVRFTDLLNSLHLSRIDFVQSLPRARRILDLGGTHQQSIEGAFVHLGYPYPFEHLTIIDLPIEDRHELYQLSENALRVETRLGPVEYAYHSMVDLSRYADGSFDLVYSGQTIEHVTSDECDIVLREVARVLAPGGWFAVDTPNGPACRLQQDEFINGDHKIEYSHAEFTAKLAAAGLGIVDAKGLNYLGAPLAEATFDMSTVAGNQGMFGEPQDCYLLAYLCRK